MTRKAAARKSRGLFNPPLKEVKKPWGKEIWFAQAPKYVGKILIINKGHRLSKQYHQIKHETLYALSGTCTIEFDGTARKLKPGQALIVPPGHVHRLEAKGSRVTLAEVSTPEVEDVVRLSDDYGRTGSHPEEKRKSTIAQKRSAGFPDQRRARRDESTSDDSALLRHMR